MDNEEYNDAVGRPPTAALVIGLLLITVFVFSMAYNFAHRKASVSHTATTAPVVSGTVITANTVEWPAQSPRDKWLADSKEFEVVALGVIADCKYADAAKWTKLNCGARLKAASEAGKKVQAEYKALPR